MTVEQIYTGCLAQGAYYIHSNGEAAIIDPLREVAPYIQKMKEDGVRIKYIFETHFHADFVSGHLSLAHRTGAPIIFGPTARPSFEAHIASDGEEFLIGNVTIRVLHTPGHTLESTTYLLLDEEGKEHAIFTGDTLFLGDVGRPDLAQPQSDLTPEKLAGMAFDSLRSKIMTLPDDVVVYPAHGAGSSCGKHMMKETVDTLGHQKKVNYALRENMTKEEFIEEVLDGLDQPPSYFSLNVNMNRSGYEDIDDVVRRGKLAHRPLVFKQIVSQVNALVLDVRSKEEFAKMHIPGSIFIGLDGSFAPWVGELIVNVRQPILIVAPEGREEETVTRLGRVGFDYALGYLEGGLKAWKEAGFDTDEVRTRDAQIIAHLQSEQKLKLYDVRKPSEYNNYHVIGSINTPLSQLNDHMSIFPYDQTFYVHCGSGYRSMIAASILKSRGFHNVIDVAGGMNALNKTHIKLEDSFCSVGAN